MSELAFWMYLWSILIAWVLLYISEVRSSDANNTGSINDLDKQEAWKMLEIRSKRVFLFSTLFVGILICCFLNWIHLMFLPKSIDVSRAISPSLPMWMLPGLFIGVTLSNFVVNHFALVSLTTGDRISYQAYQKSKSRINNTRFAKRIFITAVSLSLILITIWMNVYIIANTDAIIVKTGIPWRKKIYSYSEISAIRRKVVNSQRTENNSMKCSCDIIFFDDVVLELDKEFFFASKHIKMKFLEYLSQKSKIKIEVSAP